LCLVWVVSLTALKRANFLLIMNIKIIKSKKNNLYHFTSDINK